MKKRCDNCGYDPYCLSDTSATKYTDNLLRGSFKIVLKVVFVVMLAITVMWLNEN